MKILVLAGGSDQIALLEELSVRGHDTILLDYYENPPAKQYADKHIVASTLDVEKVKQVCIEEKVDLITTACTDQALLTVANVSEQLGLPCYLSYKTGLNVTNKLYMKAVLSENDIPTAKYSILDKVDLDAVSGFTYPIVVKPVDCNSSKGVVRIDSEEELPSCLEKAIELSRTKTAIVEEFKIGKEVSVDFYVEGRKAKLLSATTSLKIKNRKSFTILCSDYPAINKEQEIIITEIGNKVARAFGLIDCPLFIQMIVNGNDINVIEFSARMGGGSKYHLINVISGVDIMSTYVDMILGGKPTVEPSKMVKFCKMVYIYCKPGIFDHVEGFEELKTKGYIESYFVYKTKGMEITKAETSGDRPAGYLIVGDTAQELENKLRFVDSQIRVMSYDNVDIMLHNLF